MYELNSVYVMILIIIVCCQIEKNNYCLLFGVYGGFWMHWLELVWMTLWVLITHIIWAWRLISDLDFAVIGYQTYAMGLCSKEKNPWVLALRHSLKGILVISFNFLSLKFIVILCVTWQILSNLKVCCKLYHNLFATTL